MKPQNMNARERILDRINKAYQKTPKEESLAEEIVDSPFPAIEGDLIDTFKAKLVSLNGEVRHLSVEEDVNQIVEEKGLPVMCLDVDMQLVLQGDFMDKCEVGNIPKEFLSITKCESLIAQTGSVIVSSAHDKRGVFSSASTHVVIAYKSQFFSYLDDAMEQLAEKYKGNMPNQITTITGPSRTADIEKTLVMGAHGPKELIVCIIE